MLRLLKVALLRYVDDLFAPERVETMEHAMNCVARVIRALLGTNVDSSLSESSIFFLQSCAFAELLVSIFFLNF